MISALAILAVAWPRVDIQHELIEKAYKILTEPRGKQPTMRKGWELMARAFAMEFIGGRTLHRSTNEIISHWKGSLASANRPSYGEPGFFVTADWVLRSSRPTPIFLIRMACGDREHDFNEARLVVYPAAKGFITEVVDCSAPEVLPFMDGEPQLKEDRLVIAGLGSDGEMRLHPALQMWKRRRGRWQSAQTIIAEEYAGDNHWHRGRQGMPDPDRFDVERRVDSALSEGTHPAAPRRVLQEQWRFDGQRYRRVPIALQETGFLVLERFLIAMRQHRYSTAARYSSPAVVAQARKMPFSRWGWDGRIGGGDDSRDYDLYQGYDDDFRQRWRVSIGRRHGRLIVACVRRARNVTDSIYGALSHTK